MLKILVNLVEMLPSWINAMVNVIVNSLSRLTSVIHSAQCISVLQTVSRVVLSGFEGF
jgi:uncharacterized protein (DUF2342 family)